MYTKKYRETHKKEIAIYLKRYHQKNRDKHIASMKFYRDSHKEEIKQCKEIWKQKNSDKIKLQDKKYYEDNKERIDIYQKNWKIENIDYMKKYLTEYHGKFKEKLNKKNREYWEVNKKRFIEMHKQWRKTPKGKLCERVSRHKYRAKNKGLTISIVQGVYEDNIKQFGTLTCYLCLLPVPFGKDHLEHKTPLSRGGTNDYNNLAIACQKCNCKKHNKTEAEYRMEVLNYEKN